MSASPPNASQLAREVAAAIAHDLTRRPDRWCRGSMGEIGRPRTCIIGHIRKHCPDVTLARSIAAEFRRIGKIDCLFIWNDVLGRTVEDVMVLLRQVALS